MEKRILIAFLLSFAVLYGFRLLFPPPPADDSGAETAETKVEPPAPPAELPAPSVSPQPAPETEKVIQAESAEDVPIDTATYTAIISNVGGVLKSFHLKKYLDSERHPIELIDFYAATQVGFPLAFATADPALDKVLSRAEFVVQKDGNRVSLEYQANGIHARKVFDFDPEKYLVRISTELLRNGFPVPHQIVWQGRFGDQSIRDIAAKRQAVYETAGKFKRVVVTGIKEAQDITGSMVGVEDQYFLAMFLRGQEGPAKLDKQDYKLPDLENGTKGAEVRGLYVAVPAAGPMDVYIGPKLEQSLAEARPGLEEVINFGWFLFAILAKPLLIALRWLHGYIGNYGWSIVILTTLINMILFPVKVKQQLSTQKMQKLAPHLRQLQDKYKKLKPGDPKRAEVEKELMEMNKQQLSGCLPMLLQMPLLFAFLNMISASIELRGAPWILWITDLSQEDPLFILPILMGVAMFVQMKMSPSSPDPSQAKMMMVTPVLVTLLFLWYRSASALTLYWLTGNVINIGQLWFIRNYWPHGDDDTPRPRRQQAAPA